MECSFWREVVGSQRANWTEPWKQQRLVAGALQAIQRDWLCDRGCSGTVGVRDAFLEQCSIKTLSLRKWTLEGVPGHQGQGPASAGPL